MATIGYVSLWIAFLTATYTVIAFATGEKSQSPKVMKSARNGLIAVAGLITLSVLILLYALFTHNFQFEYVASYSSLNTSPGYLLSALWAGNSGSLLFWAWLLALFSVIVIVRKWNKHPDLIPYAAMVLMITEVFFLLLMVAKINPFEQLSVIPPDGAGMNLMLQNPGMVFHPPALLAGYVIFAIPFAFGISALLVRNNSEDWLIASRRYMLLAWLLLGVGNIIGAWWAYVELGWGGYWAWDPVENAGLMPWLLATAFLHSSLMQRRRGTFKIWNLVLIICTFCLVIFGTFLTRSNILHSVHTFPDAGMTPYFMVFLGIALFGPLILLYSRYDDFRGESANESFLSREGTFILNNMFLVGTTVVTLLGTILPAIFQAGGGEKMSLDASFFNTVNGPLFMAIILLAGICTLIGWRRATLKRLLHNLLWPLVAAFLVGIVLALTVVKNIPAVIGISVCNLVLFSIIIEWFKDTTVRHRATRDNYLNAWWNLVRANGQRYGGYTVHIGIVLMAIGVIGSSFYSVDKEATLKVGESISINQYVVTYKGLTAREDPDKTIVAAQLSVTSGGTILGMPAPEKFFQKSREEPVTEVAIRSSLAEDLYIILGGWDNNGANAYFKVMVNPLVSWIWIGGVIFLIGGLITFWPAHRKTSPAKTVDSSEDEY